MTTPTLASVVYLAMLFGAIVGWLLRGMFEAEPEQ
jgi:hypothetical protein